MPGYIMDLRKLVGHRTLMQCAASIIIVNEKNQILLGKRTDNHKWGYAGGSIELDEKVEDCARRELFEETGLIADEIEFFMVNSGPEVHYVYPNGDEELLDHRRACNLHERCVLHLLRAGSRVPG